MRVKDGEVGVSEGRVVSLDVARAAPGAEVEGARFRVEMTTLTAGVEVMRGLLRSGAATLAPQAGL